MKTFNYIKLFLCLVSGITLISCSKDEDIYQDKPIEPIKPIKLSFVNQSQTITQQMESISIPLKLDKKAINDGFITVELTGTAAYGSDFTTVPQAANNQLIIKLLKNTQDTSFVISRATKFSAEKLINLKLSNPTAGFSLGNTITSEVKLNAQPNIINKINFDASVGTVTEGNLEGMVIGLNTTTSVSNGSRAKVKLTIPEGIVYGTHFYTIPGSDLNEISLEFNQNAQSTNFKIIPINDNLVLGNYSIGFEIIETTGGLEIGTNKAFTATIHENDNATGTINTIAQLRSKFNDHQGNWYLARDYFIEGVITSNGNTVDNKSVYIQDATGGILIRFFRSSIFKLGDKIRLNLINATGISLNGQKCIDQVNLNGYAKYSENVYVEPETITIAQLYSGNYEGKKVKIENVYFTYANGIIKFSGSNYFTNQDRRALIKTYPSADFSDYVLPFGKLNITGIVCDYERILPQKYSHDITF